MAHAHPPEIVFAFCKQTTGLWEEDQKSVLPGSLWKTVITKPEKIGKDALEPDQIIVIDDEPPWSSKARSSPGDSTEQGAESTGPAYHFHTLGYRPCIYLHPIAGSEVSEL